MKSNHGKLAIIVEFILCLFLVSCGDIRSNQAEQEASSRETLPGQAYLVITVDEVYIRDSTDAGGEAEVSLMTMVTPKIPYQEFRKNPPGQGNIYPYSETVWMEVRENAIFRPELPIYVTPWDAAPDSVSIHIWAMDNDQGPAWISDLIGGVGNFLSTTGEIGAEVIGLLPKLAIKAYRVSAYTLLGDSWFGALLIDGLMYYLTFDQELYNQTNMAHRAAKATELIGLLLEAWGRIIDAPDTIFSDFYHSSSIILEDGEKTLIKENNWGIKEGETKASFSLCYRNQNYECVGGTPFARITFHKIFSPAEPVDLKITLKSVYLKDNRESGKPEVFIFSRFVDDATLIQDVTNAPAYLKQSQIFQASKFFLGTPNRFPTTISGVPFYTIPDNKNYFLSQDITPISGITTQSPFVYFEIGIFEDDAGAVLEDHLDWLGTYSNFFYTKDLENNEGCHSIDIGDYAIIDYCIEVEAVETMRAEEHPKPSFRPIESSHPCTFFVGFNTTSYPLNNADFRTYLAKNIDRTKLLEELNIDEQVANGFIPPVLWENHTTEIIPVGIDYDPDFFLPDDQDYPKDVEISLTLGVNNSERPLEIAWYLADIWGGELGIPVEIVVQEWEDYRESIIDGEFDAYLMSWCATEDSPYDLLSVFMQDYERNYSFYANPHYDDLLWHALENTGETAADFYKEAEVLLCVDEAGIIPIYYYILTEID